MSLRGKADGATLYLDGGALTLPARGEGQTIFVRAEDVCIGDDGPLRGKVETVTFLGTHYKIGISGITSDTIASIHAGQNAPKVGDMINVAIKPETLMLLPQEVDVA